MSFEPMAEAGAVDHRIRIADGSAIPEKQ